MTSIPQTSSVPTVPEKRNGLYFLTKDGKSHVLVSVTSVTGDAMPKPQLIYWAAKTAAREALRDPSLSEEQAASIINKSKTAGGDRGTMIHDFAEATDNGHQPDINVLDPDIRGYATAFLKFKADLKPKLVMNEKKVVNFTKGYAGRLDRIYEIGGKNVIADFKTSSNFYPENGLQLAAYRNAEFCFEDPRGPFSPMPVVHGTMVILLDQDGTYSLKDYNESIDTFMALKEVWLWLNRDKMKGIK